MRLVFTPNGWEDYCSWQTVDRSVLKRLNRLIDDTLRDPFAGIGKPERLRHAFAGCWSRRITEEHRLVYLVDGDEVVVIQARYHYEDACELLTGPGPEVWTAAKRDGTSGSASTEKGFDAAANCALIASGA